MRGNYKYEVGEEVNGLIIVTQTYTQDTKRKYRAYEVQSVSYPDAPTYITLQDNLSRGVGDAYVSGRRVFEGNSLWSKTEYRKYILDIEKAKTLPPHSSEKIEVKCDNCSKTKFMTPNKLLNYGVQCVYCSNRVSFPERMFTTYLDIKNIKYDYQVKYDDLKGRIYDYRITLNNTVFLVEVHGEQHYLTEDKKRYSVKEIQNIDSIKRQYAKNKGIEYIELDCRESTFEFIKKSIEQNEVLPNITKKEENSIIETMKINANYDITKIISMYEKEKLSTIEIGEFFGVNHGIINRILRRNNIAIRSLGEHKNLNEENIVEMYTEGSTLKELGDIYGVARQTIARVLRKNEVTIRSRGKQKK